MKSIHSFALLVAIVMICFTGIMATDTDSVYFELNDSVTLNAKDDGYRGIWYYNQLTHNEYVYKYSGGLGTYCAKHRPFAIYAPEVDKTFFCYGGTARNSNNELLHMVSCYDHRTGTVPRPTILLDKDTDDAHDNPVISLDKDGYLWIFSTSHGINRPSYIHRSEKPYDIESFKLIHPVRISGADSIPITNFSYIQPWYIDGEGFIAFFTRYFYPIQRTICYMTSPDGVVWSDWKRISLLEIGSYQISAAIKGKAGSAFNIHPLLDGLNWRTNLYYVETTDFGNSWHSADGTELILPLEKNENPALVYDALKDTLLVYLKDIRYGSDGNPVILFLTSHGWESGPQNGPRIWKTARWNGIEWDIRDAFESDNNYDTGSLYLEDDNTWRIIAPALSGPQPFNPGGEVGIWVSRDQGESWSMEKQMTHNSPQNHTYVRRPVNPNPEFYAIWADGHGRQPSDSRLYISDKAGNVMPLPTRMESGTYRLRVD